MRKAATWGDALRAVGLAVTLVLVVLIAGANFVLVEVRLLGLAFDTRLAWALLLAAALGFVAGVVFTRLRDALHRRRAGLRERERRDSNPRPPA